QEPQPALQSGDVVSTFSCECHRSTPCEADIQNESANYLMKVRFTQEQNPAYRRPNCLTASWIDFSFSMTGYMECSLKSICCARFKTSTALARGMITTPSLSAATMSPGATVTPSHFSGTWLPLNR